MSSTLMAGRARGSAAAIAASDVEAVVVTVVTDSAMTVVSTTAGWASCGAAAAGFAAVAGFAFLAGAEAFAVSAEAVALVVLATLVTFGSLAAFASFTAFDSFFVFGSWALTSAVWRGATGAASFWVVRFLAGMTAVSRVSGLGAPEPSDECGAASGAPRQPQS